MSGVDSNLFGCGPIREADERDERLFSSSASAGAQHLDMQHAQLSILSSDFNPLHKHEKDSYSSLGDSLERAVEID